MIMSTLACAGVRYPTLEWRWIMNVPAAVDKLAGQTVTLEL